MTLDSIRKLEALPPHQLDVLELSQILCDSGAESRGTTEVLILFLPLPPLHSLS